MLNITDTNQGEIVNKKAAFFSWLSLESKGMEKVGEAAERRDYVLAAVELLAYFRNRVGVNYYDGWDDRTLNPDYDTTKADETCNHHLAGQDMGADINWSDDPH